MPIRWQTWPPGLRDALIGLGFLASYVALDAISYWHPIAPVAITPWNPPPGLSIALLLLFGLRFAPLLFVAALVAEWWVRDLPAPVPVLALASAVLAGGYTLTAWGLKQILPGLRLDHVEAVTRTVALLAVATLVIGASFVGVFHAVGILDTPQIGEAVLHFWVGDLIGILVVVPLVLAFRPAQQAVRGWRPADAAWLAVLALMLWAIFSLETTDEFRWFYILFLPLIALTLRQGPRGSALAVALAQLALILFMRPRDPSAETLRDLQALLIVYAITGLFLGAILAERQRSQQLLLAQQTALAHLNRSAALSELSSALAHELNQPLSAIGLYVRACQHLQARNDSAQLHDVLEKIAREVQRAGQVVHHLREFYRSGELRCRPENLNALVRELCETHLPRAHAQHVQLSCRTDALQPRVHVDKVHLQTILDNLLRNALDALKGRKQGLIHVSIHHNDADALISVEDNAGGIPESVRAHLFTARITSKAEGLGLGLAIARQLALAHDGDLHYQAIPEGSRFLLRLPLLRAAAEEN